MKEIKHLIAELIPVGKVNAKSNPAICEDLKKYGEQFELSDIAFRDAINSIRHDYTVMPSKVLCANGRGYYWSADDLEALEYVESLKGRVEEQQKTLAAIQNKYQLVYKNRIDENWLHLKGFADGSPAGWFLLPLNSKKVGVLRRSTGAETSHIYAHFVGDDRMAIFQTKQEIVEYFGL